MATFKRILCPTDLSDTSKHALKVAAALAAWTRSPLTVQYVYVSMFMPVPGIPVPDDRVSAAEIQRTREEVSTFAAAAGCKPDSLAVDIGHPAPEILKRAENDRADLVVMGTHGASGFTRLILGSVAERVLRQSPCPVLTVPPAAPDVTPVPFRRILCAVDFSEWSTTALDLAATLAVDAQASLTVVHSIEWPWHEPPAPEFSALPREQAEALLEFRRYTVDRATARLNDTVRSVVGDRCEADVVVGNGKAYEEVVRLASACAADLIVLGVHGRSKLDLALFGSTASQVVRHAACPVLTVRR